jgi:Uma2 family endonuclease
MRMSAPSTPVTADQLAEFPDDGQRYEVIDGVLYVTPVPSRIHQRAQTQLATRLHGYAKSLGLEVLMAPIAVRASETTEVQPDLIVLPRHAAGRNETPYEKLPALVLAIEIISPSSVRTDRGVKRRLYVDGGVKEYWAVDTAARKVERWFAGRVAAEVCTDALTWLPMPGRDDLAIDLVDYFHDVCDD